MGNLIHIFPRTVEIFAHFNTPNATYQILDEEVF